MEAFCVGGVLGCFFLSVQYICIGNENNDKISFWIFTRDSPSKRRTGLSVCTKGQPVIGACSSCIHIPGKWIVALCAQTAGV